MEATKLKVWYIFYDMSKWQNVILCRISFENKRKVDLRVWNNIRCLYNKGLSFYIIVGIYATKDKRQLWIVSGSNKSKTCFNTSIVLMHKINHPSCPQGLLFWGLSLDLGIKTKHQWVYHCVKILAASINSFTLQLKIENTTNRIVSFRKKTIYSNHSIKFINN